MRDRIARFARNVWAVAYRDAAIIRHDKTMIGVIAVQPVMMILLFGLALSNEPANVPWAVLDQSHSHASRRLAQDIESTGYFVPPVSVASWDEGRDLLRRGKAVALVVIPRDFHRDALRGAPEIQVLVDGADPLTAARVGGYIGQVARTGKSRRIGDVGHWRRRCFDDPVAVRLGLRDQSPQLRRDRIHRAPKSADAHPAAARRPSP